MTEYQITFLNLTQSAVLNDTHKSATLKHVDWMLMLEIASQQGIKGLLWQAIQNDCSLSDNLSIDEKMEWFGQSLIMEQKILRAHKLSDEYASFIFPYQCVVLKGINYAQYWPNPLHREFGDLDHWSGIDVDVVNRKAAARGVVVESDDYEHYKHSHSHYKGLTVENHRYFTSHNGSPQGIATESYLKETLLSLPLHSIKGSKYLLAPNPTFTALFMLRHAQLHFISEGIQLRHVLDWYFFIKKEHSAIDWNKVNKGYDVMRLRNFANLMTSICVTWFGLDRSIAELIGGYTEPSTALKQAFLEDIFYEKPDLTDMRLRSKAKRIFRRFGRMFTFRTLLNEPYWLIVGQSLIYNSVTGIKPVNIQQN